MTLFRHKLISYGLMAIIASSAIPQPAYAFSQTSKQNSQKNSQKNSSKNSSNNSSTLQSTNDKIINNADSTESAEDSAEAPLNDAQSSGFLESIKEQLSKFRFSEPVFDNDKLTFGILAIMLGLIFWASQQKKGNVWSSSALGVFGLLTALALVFNTSIGSLTNEQAGTASSMSQIFRFCYCYVLPLGLIASVLSFAPLYRVLPMLLLCYFAPSLLTAFGWVDPKQSELYAVATRYLLPASLVLLTLSIDLGAILRLGPKAVIMFLTGTIGVVLGGPIAVLIVGYFSPEIFVTDNGAETWRGLSTVAGSWIGGGANQTAMKEIFMAAGEDASLNEDFEKLYTVMVAVDVLIAEFWMIFLLLGVGKAKKIDQLFRADTSAVEQLQAKMADFSDSNARVASSTDLMVILGISFGITSICHLLGGQLGPWIGENAPFLNRFSLDSTFFWLIIFATTFGVGLSFTPLRQYEGAGASKIGTVFIFILVATIGMKMDVFAIFEHPKLFLVGGIWMLFHVGLLFAVGYWIRAPYFFLAVGSKANIGGAASAPVVAAAFHPSLAPVGVLLAVLGYALGTYGAWLCAMMMQIASP